jgi:plastocyanin
MTAARLALATVAALLLVVAPASGAERKRSAARLVAVTAPPPEHLADPGLKTYVYRFGPHKIGPYQVANGTDTVSPPPVDGAIVGMDTRLITRGGAEVPQSQAMLHHIVYTDGGPARPKAGDERSEADRRRDAACPQRPVYQRFFGTSEELRPLTLPRGYGYEITRRDRWRTSWMVMNHQSTNRNALLEYRVTVDPNPAVAPVEPLWLSVLPCRKSPDPQYSVPGGGKPGSTHYRSRTWKLPVSGRIVAMGGHMHGGARNLTVSEPNCGGRTIYTAQPTYATPEDPLYAVKPLLHEPDPKHISWSQSANGWNAPRGTRLRVTAAYDAERPHMRVMGIAHVYVARGPAAAEACVPPPADALSLDAPFAGRRDPPAVDLTLATLGRDGVATPIDRPAGRLVRRRGDTRVRVNHFAFKKPNLSIPRGSRITWSFGGRTRHDATLARGPVGFASPFSSHDDRWSRRFETPGAYRIYCSLHPVYMSQYVRVR